LLATTVNNLSALTFSLVGLALVPVELLLALACLHVTGVV
jgi:hypothetical protein